MEKLSIIITEDDKWYAEFIKHTLSLTGDYNIQIVHTAEQLMAKLNAQPDIVKLDFNLPDAKGEKILERIKKKCPESKVIIISGQEDVQIAVNLLSKGALDYVVKNGANMRAGSIMSAWNGTNATVKNSTLTDNAATSLVNVNTI